MAPWIQGILTTLAVAIACVGAGLLAVAAARFLRLDLLLSRFANARTDSTGIVIDRLAAIADIAKEEGLLRAEAHVDQHAEPALARGLRSALDGADEQQINDAIHAAIDTVACPAPAGVCRILSEPRVPMMLAILGAGTLLLMMIGNASAPNAVPAVGAALGFLLLIAASVLLTLQGPIAGRLAGLRRDAAFAAVLQARAVQLIVSGADGAKVRAALQAMLPPSHRPSVRIAQAA
jgi:flagellar motor component MotA